METRRGVKRTSLAAPERAVKRARVSRPSSGDESESSSRSESQEEPLIRLDLNKMGPRIWDEHLSKKEVDADLKAMGCEGYGKMSMENWEAQTAKKMGDKIVAGKGRAHAAYKEFRRGYLVQGNAIKRLRRKEEEEEEGLIGAEERGPLYQQFPVNFMDIDRDEDVVKRYEESVRLRRPPEEVTLYERPRVAPYTLKENPVLTEGSETIEDDMAIFNDPFGERLGPEDEVPALLQCVDFKGSPVMRDGLDVAAIAMEHLPFPLNEVAFLEEYVQPIFAAERKCRNGGLLDRLENCEAVAKRILAVVDAADKYWQQWVTFSETEWLKQTVGREFSPLRTYSICRDAYRQLEREVDALLLTHRNCKYVQSATALALVRAERRTAFQMEMKPVLATDLPEPPSPRERLAWAAMVVGRQVGIDLRTAEAGGGGRCKGWHA